MSKMRKNFVWTKVYDTHLLQMKAQGTSCAEVADFINHNVSRQNETNKHNVSLITTQDVVDRYQLLKHPLTVEVRGPNTTVKHILVTGGERTIAVTLPLVPLRA